MNEPRKDTCHGPTGRGKLAFAHRASARQAARSLGRTFDGKMKKVYKCPGCGQYHLATR